MTTKKGRKKQALKDEAKQIENQFGLIGSPFETVIDGLIDIFGDDDEDEEEQEESTSSFIPDFDSDDDDSSDGFGGGDSGGGGASSDWDD